MRRGERRNRHVDVRRRRDYAWLIFSSVFFAQHTLNRFVRRPARSSITSVANRKRCSEAHDYSTPIFVVDRPRGQHRIVWRGGCTPLFLVACRWYRSRRPPRCL